VFSPFASSLRSVRQLASICDHQESAAAELDVSSVSLCALTVPPLGSPASQSRGDPRTVAEIVG